MVRRKVNSFNILTSEDKQYLRRVCRYLSSLGMQDGSIEMDVDSWYDFDFNDIDWDNQITHFSNNYGAEIPSGLIPILKKIGEYAQENSLLGTPEEEDISYERIDFDIDCQKSEISINHWWSFIKRGNGDSINWDSEEGKEMLEEWENEGVFADLTIPDNGILTIKYNGSGDSGYIESNFDETMESVPASIEDWCYNELERNYGGWEINEGSDGEFTFDFNNSTIHLYHAYNIEEEGHDTIYEESFAE